LFSLIVMVDWSAANQPGPQRETKDKVWIAWGDQRARPAPLYCRTREAAFRHLEALLADCPGLAIVGFDFPHGYPYGSRMGGGRKVAKRLARLVTDGPDNRSNRFEVARRLNREIGDPPGPFWMCPAKEADRVLPLKRPPFEHRRFGEYRIVDARLRARGKYPHSVWKLCGAGSVGSQALLGMVVVHRLLSSPALADRSRVWPFETAWDEHLDGIVHTEIWPSLFALDGQRHPIKDARQVAAVRDALLDADRRGVLRPLFARPSGLSERQNRICLTQEGWILGVE
jgi:precorrin-8X/cobalt-precorrin-8 methylmutase